MTPQEMEHLARDQSKQDILQFIEDMQESGLTIKYYRGRFFWHGPAVITDDLQEALSGTGVRCQWDNMGLGFVVYPHQSFRQEQENAA